MASPLIRSRANAAVRRFRALKERTGGDLALLEGAKLVEEALAAGVEVAEVAASPRARRSPRGRAVLGMLQARGIPIRAMDDDILGSISEAETSQGIVALARRPSFADETLFRGVPLLLVAVRVQNPGNVGALMRAAEAAGATGAYLTEGCADPLSWKALRGSMGSAFRLPHRRGAGARATLDRLEARGVVTVAAAPTAGTRYDQVDLTRPVALVLGSEGSGLDEEMAAAAAERVSIPMAGRVESLNVAVAAGILFFEAARQRRG